MAIAASTFNAGSAGAIEPDNFTFAGAGWGHGVGFSQWGARGQAIDDPTKTGEQIVSYYYTDSQVRDLSSLSLPNDYLDTVDEPLWVGLAQNVQVLQFSAVGGPLELCMSDGASGCISPGPPAAGETWTFERISTGVCAWYRDGTQQGATGDCRASIEWPGADGVQVKDLTNSAPICGGVSNLSACEYRDGVLKLRDDPVEVGFHVVLAVALEDYLKGIGELPENWSRAGVNRAQAIASRSYAAFEFFANEVGGRTAFDAGLSDSQKNACWCHTNDDTRDQLFVGWDHEVGAADWVAAVEATNGRVLTYLESGYQSFTQAGIVQAFYFSSSGGWTESNTAGFGSSIQVPYLLPVADPWSIEPATGNPNASWEKTIDATTIADRLGWDSVSGATLDGGPPGAIVRFTGVDDGSSVSTTRGVQWLRTSLGLLSGMVTAIDGFGVGPPPVFADIAGSVHEAAIIEVYEAGITQGCRTGFYCPGDSVSRGQMASFLAAALELPSPGGDYFADDGGSVHERAINQLYEAQITIGCADGLYCPNRPVSREQMAAFLARSLNLTTESGDAFIDDDDSPFKAEIAAIAAAGITVGCDVDRFCPLEPVSRAQMATFIVRGFLMDP